MDFATAASLPNCVRKRMEKLKRRKGQKPRKIITSCYCVTTTTTTPLRWFLRYAFVSELNVCAHSFHTIFFSFFFIFIPSSTTMWYLIVFFPRVFLCDYFITMHTQMNANFLPNEKYIMLPVYIPYCLLYDRLLFSSGFVRAMCVCVCFGVIFKSHTNAYLRTHKRQKQRSENNTATTTTKKKEKLKFLLLMM